MGYLFDKVGEIDFLKDTTFLRLLDDITALNDNDKDHILYTIDHLLAFLKKKEAAYK